MPAINLNRRGYYVAGITRWDDGRECTFNEYRSEPMVCPVIERYGPEVGTDDPAHHRFRLSKGCTGYTITFLSCVKMNDAEQER